MDSRLTASTIHCCISMPLALSTSPGTHALMTSGVMAMMMNMAKTQLMFFHRLRCFTVPKNMNMSTPQ